MYIHVARVYMSNCSKWAHKNLANGTARKYPSENISGHVNIKGHIAHKTIYKFEDYMRVCVPAGV